MTTNDNSEQPKPLTYETWKGSRADLGDKIKSISHGESALSVLVEYFSGHFRRQWFATTQDAELELIRLSEQMVAEKVAERRAAFLPLLAPAADTEGADDLVSRRDVIALLNHLPYNPPGAPKTTVADAIDLMVSQVIHLPGRPRNPVAHILEGLADVKTWHQPQCPSCPHAYDLHGSVLGCQAEGCICQQNQATLTGEAPRG